MIQVLGATGFCANIACAAMRITAIYEGTSGIQALMLAGRLLKARGGRAADAFDRWLAKRTPAARREDWRALRRHAAASPSPAEPEEA